MTPADDAREGGGRATQGAVAELLVQNLQRSIAAKQLFLTHADQIAAFASMVDTVVAAYQAGGRLYLAGNGGSAAQAQHIASELVVRLAKDRRALAAEALTTDGALLTAIINDYGPDPLFARQIEAKARPGDVFLGITTSGRSPNIIAALKQCRSLRLPCIVFTGRDGGLARALADHCIVAAGDATSIIQEMHQVFGHTLCEAVERTLFPV